MKGFLLLLSFMTRIPMPKIEYNEEKLGKSMKYFPVVGIIVGLILLFFSIVFTFILKNLAYTAVLPIIIMVIILTDLITTGALHLDGLADTFDGIFSYRSKHKMLEIMKDSRLGSNGALALILYFLIKFALFYSLIIENQGEAIYAVITYPVVARFCSVISCASAPYARGSGMGKTFVDNTKTCGVIVATTITLLYIIGMIFMPFVLFTNYSLPLYFIAQSIVINVVIVLLLGLFAYAFSKLIERKIGGITGDTLGALLEISSLVYLFLLLVIPTFF
ncbi:adenosylcobinamide-GDP ribazoletransferase [Fusobacterium simiae]|uniref:Adenosylcobinamide-GDP ribazoletransferase n=1 Tax=Fusobacterium simiae TaxID=855 RepID=A0ABT4DM78_FUSSI|nr:MULTISPECIES: adenosylcobinamide-GDP ribazoletransferase [Fusobacterium]MCY7009093.1 adenosylcobinamide-GDP ribazoletransferase [Fusobacterium simiae]MDC7955207.1 adenosylcobinamide-GDP ribazoletransferase [Fusobacterium simiae]